MTQAIWGDPRFAVQHWGNRRGKPWKGSEYVKARQMQSEGVSVDEIATQLGRTIWSVRQKLETKGRVV